VSAADELIKQDRRSLLRGESGGVISDLPSDARRTPRFEGVYGGIYNRVIQTTPMRRAIFKLWGSCDPLYDLERFVGDAVVSLRAATTSPVAVDLPSGGGTLLPMMLRSGFRGTVVEVDLATTMLQRAVRLEAKLAAPFTTLFLRTDALDLPLRDAVADVVVSINGLHVMSDHEGFLAEIARIAKPGAGVWLITPVDGPSRRSRVILRAAERLGVTSRTPPTLAELRRLLEAVGLRETRWYGGRSITGVSCRRVEDPSHA
jgi:ubiquinone/menaquinone biosynthesis C-methylase UbiE